MKSVLFAFILCFVSLTSANEVLNSQANNVSNTYQSTSHLQELAYQQDKHLINGVIVDRQNDIATNNSNEISDRRGGSYQQQQPHFHDTALTHRQADASNNETNRVNQQNRSRLPENKNQLKRRSQNTTVAQREDYPVADRIIHPRFRPLVETGKDQLTRSPLSKSNITLIPDSYIQANRPLLADERFIGNTTKSSALLRTFTTKAIGQTRKRLSFADQYYQQQIRAFFAHNHKKMTPRAHSNVKTGLRR